MAAPPKAPATYRVYQAVNRTTREALVSFSSEPMSSVRADVLRNPPSGFAHWKRKHNIVFRVVSGSLALDGAVFYARLHCVHPTLQGYRTLLLD